MNARRKRIQDSLKDYPDFPKPGIIFKDIMEILRQPSVFKDCIDELEESARASDVLLQNEKIDFVVGLEARGFLFGPSLAQRFNCGFVPIRKAGKLPGECTSVSYIKEYGEDTFEIQKTSIFKGARVLILDDLIALGGTMKAAIELVDKTGGIPVLALVIIELSFLNGRKALPAHVPLVSLLD